jgi:hypothetical protein
MKVLMFLAAGLVLLSGCADRVTVVGMPGRAVLTDSVNLYGHPLELRMSRPVGPDPGILVVFATGDGGWHSLDEALYRWITESDVATVGFSSKNYLKNLGYVSTTDTTTPKRLMLDFQPVIAAAKRRMGLPESTRVVLAGMSRGAGLVVVAAGEREFQPSLAGVIAVALTREEEHVVRARQHGNPGDRHPRQLVKIKTYEYLHRLRTIPVAVIQSTNDGYLPAAAARELFGPDTEWRRFQAVEAHNHTFGGGWELLQRNVRDSLRWVEQASGMRGESPSGGPSPGWRVD